MPRRPDVRLTRRGRLIVAVVVVAVLGGGAWRFRDVVTGEGTSAAPTPEATGSGDGAATPSPTPSPTPEPGTVRRADAESGAWLLEDDPGAAVVALARGVLVEAPVVVVADTDVVTAARGVAWRTRAPLVPRGAPGLDDLLDDLATTTVVHVVGARDADASTSPSPADLDVGDRRVVRVPVDGTSVDRAPLDDVAVPDPPAGGDAPLVLVGADDPARPLLDTVALAADVSVLAVDGPVGEDPDVVARLRRGADQPWLGAGTAGAWDGVDRDVLAWDVAVARSGQELPGGGLRMFPGRVMVALYGSPGAASLGVLGEQPVDAAVQRARELAAPYEPLTEHPVVPTFEIITTVASGGPEPTGDYSRRVPHDLIEPWIEAAGEAGVYVILDLQPGRTDFLTQAKEVEPLLRHPHVGLALDPEWRLRPDQVHLRQIGSVGVEEVQQVADWLADLTRRERLPQKLLLLHQFRLSMLPDRERLQVPPELAVAIQMDGQGSQGAKDATWQAVTQLDPPAGVHFGWKNFYDEDTTLRSPADTMAVEPTPVLVSYQ